MINKLKQLVPTSLRTKILSFLTTAPSCHYHNRLLNELGINCFRMVFYHFRRSLKKVPKISPENKQYVDDLIKNGYVIIEDFLPDDDFSKMEQEYKDYYDNFAVASMKHPVQKRLRITNATREYFHYDGEKPPVYKRTFLENSRIREIVSAVTRSKIQRIPDSTYSEDFYREEDLGKKSENTAVRPHYDVPYTSLKVFLYLKDTDENNAAFRYVPGSHKFSLKRLILEFYSSRNFSRTNNEIQVNYDDQKFFHDYLEKKEKALTGKKNTAIIFDVMGVHRRGEFKTPRKRQVALLCFRSLETLSNKYSGLVSKLINV